MSLMLHLGRTMAPGGRLSHRSFTSCRSLSTTSIRRQEAIQEAATPSYPGWKVLEERRIHEFDIEATLLEHQKTRARYLHMACQDDNNAFSVNFRTTPMDSTGPASFHKEIHLIISYSPVKTFISAGVAHILEHTALCGSDKFPVRDPFMKMLNRSLSTFMNAMTGPDYTLYPFSTCNRYGSWSC